MRRNKLPRHRSTPATTQLFTGLAGPHGQPFDALADRPLLASMEQGGLDWPSSCRNGTCRTCMAQLVRGRVRYEIEWPGLSAEEKLTGYVLPCVAFPCGDLVLQREGAQRVVCHAAAAPHA